MHSVLLIGCGNIAGGLDAGRPEDAMPFTHAGAYRRHGGFRMEACVDPDTARREAFQVRWGVACGHDDIAGLAVKPGSFDVVSICSPTHLHARHVREAVSLRPRVIFCEKPLGDDLAEAEQLADECAAAGVKLAVNYTRRWAPDVVALADELRRGDWGRVRAATGVYTKGVVHNGGHLVDLLRLLLGELELVGAGSAVADFHPRDPSVSALLRSAAGAAVHLVPGHAGDYAIFELELITEQGVIAMLDAGRSWQFRRARDSDVFPGYRTLDEGEYVSGRYDEAMLAAVTNIVGVLDRNEALASSPENAVAAQRLCEAIRAAALF